MNSVFTAKSAVFKKSENSTLLLLCLAFLMGVGGFALFFGFSSDINLVEADISCFACVFSVFLLQISAFSALGTFFIPLLLCGIGAISSYALACVIFVSDLSFLFLAKLFAVLWIFVLFALYIAISASGSADAVFSKIRRDKRFKMDILKTLVIISLFVILSFIGASDFNMIS